MEETKTFAEFAISEDVLQAISDMGFEEPTPIQVMAIPQILEGNDVTGQAQTGTGKTAGCGKKSRPRNGQLYPGAVLHALRAEPQLPEQAHFPAYSAVPRYSDLH